MIQNIKDKGLLLTKDNSKLASQYESLATQLTQSSNWKKIKNLLAQIKITGWLDNLEGLSLDPKLFIQQFEGFQDAPHSANLAYIKDLDKIDIE